MFKPTLLARRLCQRLFIMTTTRTRPRLMAHASPSPAVSRSLPVVEQAAEQLGLRALMTHPIDGDAQFYRRFGF
jgi:hypothetical protein